MTFIMAFQKDDEWVYRVWAEEEQKFLPDMNHDEIHRWADVKVQEFSRAIAHRVAEAADRGTSGVFAAEIE